MCQGNACNRPNTEQRVRKNPWGALRVEPIPSLQVKVKVIATGKYHRVGNELEHAHADQNFLTSSAMSRFRV